MRRRDAFCASQASTAIFLTMDEPSSSSSSNAVQLGGKTIDRHNPIIRDHKRTPRTLPPLAPSTSQPPPINPKPYHLLHKNKKISFATEHSKKLSSKSKKLSSESAINDDEDAKKKKSDTEFTVSKDIATNTWIDQRRDFITPPGSSRYLLGESSRFYDGISNLDSGFGSIPDESNKAKILISEYESSASKTSSSRSEKPNSDQVVVLRVSLHCRGCEGKVRKHLSRMQELPKGVPIPPSGPSKGNSADRPPPPLPYWGRKAGLLPPSPVFSPGSHFHGLPKYVPIPLSGPGRGD